MILISCTILRPIMYSVVQDYTRAVNNTAQNTDTKVALKYIRLCR